MCAAQVIEGGWMMGCAGTKWQGFRHADPNYICNEHKIRIQTNTKNTPNNHSTAKLPAASSPLIPPLSIASYDMDLT